MRLKNLSLSYGSSLLKALSDEARIRILNLLLHHKELCISDMEQILDFTQTKTSRHIHYLKNAGIVTARKADQWIFYHITDEVEDIIAAILSYIAKDQILTSDTDTLQVMDSNRELAAFRHKISGTGN
jgi:ArsR family transcriptional regulator